jgi:hypothetical protein
MAFTQPEERTKKPTTALQAWRGLNEASGNLTVRSLSHSFLDIKAIHSDSLRNIDARFKDFSFRLRSGLRSFKAVARTANSGANPDFLPRSTGQGRAFQ